MKDWTFLISIDFSEILDRLTIYHIKYNNSKELSVKNDISLQIKSLERRILKKTGFSLFQEIIRSEEYNNLYEANQKIFDGVNLAEQDKDGKVLSAHQLNNLNKKRTKAKILLMNKFCGKSPNEVKIGGGKIENS